MRYPRFRSIAVSVVATLMITCWAHSVNAQSDDPEAARLQFQQGQKLADAKKRVEALPYFQEAIRLAPNYYHGYWGLGYTQLLLERFADAEKNLQRALELMPAAEAASNVGAQTREMKDFAAKHARQQTTSRVPAATPASTPGTAGTPAMFYDDWSFRSMVWKEADGTVNPTSAWGDLKFERNGTFKYVLHIGKFQNHHSGTYKLSGDRLVMTEKDGKVLHDFTYSIDQNKGFLLLRSKDSDGGLTIYELELKSNKTR